MRHEFQPRMKEVAEVPPRHIENQPLTIILVAEPGEHDAGDCFLPAHLVLPGIWFQIVEHQTWPHQVRPGFDVWH
eukprot:8691364-Karenia_brevis.AAC.1